MRGKSSDFISILTVAALILAATATFAQPTAPVITQPKSKKNTLGLILSMREYFDGSPFWQPRYPRVILRWMNLGLGLQYSRKLHERHGFGLSVTAASIHYFSSDLKRGDTFERGILSFDAFYQVRILHRKNTECSAIVGPNYRYGFETVLAYTDGHNVLLTNYDLGDIGFSIGIRLSQSILRNLILSPEIRFTSYVYRHARHQPRYTTEFPNRPTRHMLTLQLGLGYRF